MASTLIDLLDEATTRPEGRLTCVDGPTWTYDELAEAAAVCAGTLQRLGVTRGSAVVIQRADPGDVVVAFWGCVMAGAVAVPLPVPRTAADGERLQAVCAQLDEALVLDDSVVLSDGGPPASGQSPEPQDVALLQFSSGSTGTPKGVVLTHANLVANLQDMRQRAGITPTDVGLGWMPLTHDMGLVGTHLLMVCAGGAQVLWRPHAFLRRPLRWLQLASEHGATLLAAPNFGLDYALAHLRSRGVPEGFDLSAVRLVVVGADPLDPGTLAQFAEWLAPVGLRSGALYPVYGLAEASVAVTFPAQLGAPLSVARFVRDRLAVGDRAEVASEGRALVGCGTPLPSTELRVVDDAGQALPEGTVGHLQVRGANVTSGYLGQPAEGLVSDGWLRTGDLGLLHAGQLYVTGRHKEIVILGGVNHDLADLERLARGGRDLDVAAVAVHSEGRDQLVLLVRHRVSAAKAREVTDGLRRRLLEAAGLLADAVAPVRAIPKTTSGKVRRAALQAAAREALRAQQPLAAPCALTVDDVLQRVRAWTGATELQADTPLLE
ncbi:MAG: AMP-binding protein, partial [Myxococcales bacterium]|nr:AMP-binding protein [Myxococcales bacterium]